MENNNEINNSEIKNKKQFELGPAMAIVIVLALVVGAGSYWYNNMMPTMQYDTISIQNVRNILTNKQQSAETVVEENSDLSDSSELTDLEADLDATNTEEDLSVLDELDQELDELLDFSDLDELDLDI